MSYQNRRQHSGPGPLPKRWLHCPRKSDSIVAERFMAFKTPLSGLFNDQIPAQYRFTPDMIFGYFNSIKMRLGLWIDLTNTNRFYDRKIVEEKGIQYIKLQCRGHGETPSLEQVRSFIEIVDNFINERPIDLIGIHCTHGFNRTGFLIVSYLVERLDCSLEAALSMFSQSRPPGIYKQDYIDELFKRYETIEDTIPAPELPAWCYQDESDMDNPIFNTKKIKRSHEDSDSDGAEYNDVYEQEPNSDQKKKKKRRREHFIPDAKFMDESIPNITLVSEQPTLSELQCQVQDMCEWEKNGFPGCQPVSLNRQNIELLHTNPYRVSWKADGTRYMMLVKDRDEVYFFDRNNSCFKVDNLNFPRASNLHEHLKDTLLDGEMVLDVFQGKTTPRYLVYDIIQIEGRPVGKDPFFPNRLSCIRKEVIQPRREAKMKQIIPDSEPIGVREKEFWSIDLSSYLLSEKFAKKLCHQPDGLIFQPSKPPYKPGVSQEVFKWKPSDMNSIDFRLKIVYESGEGIVKKKIGALFVGTQEEVLFGRIKVNKNLSQYDNKIIECYLNPQNEWVFMRERTDKTHPNSYNTAVAVHESIKSPVTQEYLLDMIANYGYKESMPPPATPHHMSSSHQHHGHPQQNHPRPQQHQGHPHHQHHPPPQQYRSLPPQHNPQPNQFHSYTQQPNQQLPNPHKMPQRQNSQPLAHAQSQP